MNPPLIGERVSIVNPSKQYKVFEGHIGFVNSFVSGLNCYEVEFAINERKIIQYLSEEQLKIES
jgi:hypothetical protein